jgi:hypothetical protein
MFKNLHLCQIMFEFLQALNLIFLKNIKWDLDDFLNVKSVK